MIDIDTRIRDYAAAWQEQPAPDLGGALRGVESSRRPRRRAVWLIGAAAVIVLGVAALAVVLTRGGGPTEPPAVPAGNFGTIVGTLREVGGDAPGINVGVSGTVRAVPARSRAPLGASAVATGRADADGHFTLRMPAGAYLLVGDTPQVSITPAPASPICRSRHPAVVHRGQTVHIDVICDIK